MLPKLSYLAHVDPLLDIRSFGELLLIHAELFLVLLETHVDAVDQNLAVDIVLIMSNLCVLLQRLLLVLAFLAASDW